MRVCAPGVLMSEGKEEERPGSRRKRKFTFPPLFFFALLERSANWITLTLTGEGIFSLSLPIQIFWTYLLSMHAVMSDSLRPHGLYSQPGSSVHGIFQATILECVVISSSNPPPETPRNNVSPAMWASLSPGKLTHEVNHHLSIIHFLPIT